MKKIRPRDAAAVGIIGGQDGPIAIDVNTVSPRRRWRRCLPYWLRLRPGRCMPSCAAAERSTGED